MAPLGQLFGVSLETVLENEASGFLIPLLVKLCIQVAIIITDIYVTFLSAYDYYHHHQSNQELIYTDVMSTGESTRGNV